ncbi:MAG: DUF3325 domain-containing protein [Pseudomonadota bacterium]
MITLVLWAMAAFTSALSGFAALSMAMDRHYEDSFGRGKSPGRLRRWMQAGGSAALLLSLGICLAMAGSSQGWVLWFGELTAGAIVLVLVLTYAPKRAMRLSWIAGGIALLATLAGVLLR